MIKAVLGYLHSPDVDDLRTFIPEDPECFGVFVQAIFGQQGIGGEESFGFMLCTPAWLGRELKGASILNGRHHLIVGKYDFEALTRYILRFAEECSGESWSEVATKLSRLGMWEFEDYTAHKSP